MKVKNDREAEEIKLNMTAMIDIVFQLLVFFIMTFKIVAMEGDFNVKMPLPSDQAMDVDQVLPEVITVKMASGQNGNISNIEVSTDGAPEETFTESTMYNDLQKYIERKIAAGSDPTTGSDTEVEFDIDYNLKYGYTVRALDAVSGQVQPDGSVKKLIESIKFKNSSQ